MEYVNGERLAAGSAALERNARLEKVAQAVARTESVHTRPEIGTIGEAVQDLGSTRFGESVAAEAEWRDVPPALLDEPHERREMTSTEFTQVGIGVAFDPTNRMWIHAVVAD